MTDIKSAEVWLSTEQFWSCRSPQNSSGAVVVLRTVLELLSQTQLQRSAEHLKQLRLDLNIRSLHQLVCVITV